MMVSRSVGIMPNPLDTREIFYSNLLLLHFDPVAMESREKIPFNRDMFALPNKKAMEVVMYFMFSKLNPQMTYEEFRGCWPVKNKVDEQKFRKTCYNWVSRLSKEESDTYFPRVVQSLFHSPGGDKFYNFLLLFSMYVLKVVMLRDHSRHVSIPTFPSKSIHNHSFSQVISKSLQVHTSLHRKRFLELTQYSLEVQQHWKSYAIELNKENRRLKKKKREIEKQLQKETSYKGEQMAKSMAYSNDYQREVDTLQRTQHLQKVRVLWKGLEEFYLEHKPQVVESVLTNQANQHHLDATDVEVKIPDLLLREFERDIHMKRIGNTYIGGKLNLLSLVQLWNLSLNLVKDKIQQDSVPGFDESSPKIKNDIHTHQSLLTNAEYLRSTLTKETIPELKQSVDQLKTKIYQDMIELEGMLQAQHPPAFKLGLGLIPATPPISFKAAETPASQRITSFQESLRRTPAAVSTPDVINAWSESLVGRRPPVHSHKTHLSKPNRPDKDSKKTKVDHHTQIPKPKTIQAGLTRNYYKIGHEKHHKTLTKKTLSSSARRQGATKSRRDDIVSPLASDHSRKGARTEPRRASHKETVKTKGKESATDDVANQIIGALSADKPDSGSSTQSSRSSTPKPQAIDDPLEALDEKAFVSRDLLSRTPGPKESYDPTSEPSYSEERLTARRSILNDSGGLLETILDHVMEPAPTAKSVRTSLFSSPDNHEDSHHEDSFTEHYRPSSQQELLPPYHFTTPRVFDEDNDERKNLLTPFSFVTPLNVPNSLAKRKIEHGFSSLTAKAEVKEGESSDSTPKVERLIQFTPMADKMSLKETNEVIYSTAKLTHAEGITNQTPKAERLVQFTPMSQKQSDSVGNDATDLRSPFMLSKMFEEQLSLSNKKLTVGSPVSPVSNGNMGYDHSMSGAHRSQISLFEPTVVNESNTETLIEEGERYDDKRSPFGALNISDDEDESRETGTNRSNAEEYKEMHESDLMSRLNRIKAAQRYDFKYLSPSQDTGRVESGDEHNDVAIETIQAKRLDQIKEAQQGQQVTPGANTQGNLEPYRGTEGALLTPLTASSAGSPENGATDHVSRFPYEDNIKSMTSNASTPTSMLSERFLRESPRRKDRDEIVFSLDSPVLPSTFSNGLSPSAERHVPEKGPNQVGSRSGLDMGASSSEHLFSSAHSPIPSLLKNDDKMVWLASNGATPTKDITVPVDRRFSYDNFLNESIDTSFLVQGTPRHEPLQGSHGALRTPLKDHETKSRDSDAMATVTSSRLSASPATGHLIDF